MNESKIREHIASVRAKVERTRDTAVETLAPDQRETLIRCAEETARLVKGTSPLWKSELAEYSSAVADCVALWKNIQALRQRYRKADLTLSAYYQRGKLRDYLEEVVRFAQADIKPTDTPEKLAVKGYNNFLFVVKTTWEELKQKQEAFIEEKTEDVAPIRSFLMTQCRGNPFYDNWFDLRDRILSAKKKDGGLSRREYGILVEELEMTEHTLLRQKEELTAFLRERQSAMQTQAGRMETEAQKGESLYTALEALLTQELFQKMDPEGDTVGQMDMTEIKAEYRALAGKIQEDILDKFERS